MEQLNDEAPDDGSNAFHQQAALLKEQGFGSDVPEQEEQVIYLELVMNAFYNYVTTSNLVIVVDVVLYNNSGSCCRLMLL